LRAAEPRYVLQSPKLVENCVGLYVPLLEFNHIGNGVDGNGGSSSRGGIVSGLTTASRFSSHMASSLVRGVGATAKAEVKGATANMQNRMAQTILGRVASAIRQSSQASSKNTPITEPVQESPMTADQARGFHGPESIPDVRAEAQDFINGSRGSEMT
jgi:hypothetical protein